jgi:hypothetical protein
LIYSLFLQRKQPGHGLDSSYDTGLQIIFPTFQTTAIVGRDDIYLDAIPHVDTNVTTDLVPSLPFSSEDTVCHHLIQFDETALGNTKQDTNLLKSLCQYYSTVKTKRQLNLDVPASFHQSTSLQRGFNTFLPPCKVRSSIELPTADPSLSDSMVTNIPDNPPTSFTNLSSAVSVPMLRCVDKISTSLPSRLTFTEDYIRTSIGFRRIDTIKSHLHYLYQDTVSLDSSLADAILDKGDFSTIWKSAHSTTPVVCPSNFGDVIHMDIVFGPDISIGNIRMGFYLLINIAE